MAYESSLHVECTAVVHQRSDKGMSYIRVGGGNVVDEYRLTSLVGFPIILDH